ncbi:MAG: LamG domain-containing protein, partial [Dolichospermum sp.]
LALTGTVTIEIFGTNSGNNGTQNIAVDDFILNGSVTLNANVAYAHSFTSGSVASNIYNQAPDIIASGLTVGSTQWAGDGTTSLTNCSGNQNLAVAVPTAGSTKKLTLTLNVALGHTFNLTGIATKFTSGINNGGFGINVNGNSYYSNVQVLQACPGLSITQNTPLALTGTVTIEIFGTNSGNNGTQNIAVDDFILSGTITKIPAPGNALNFDGTNDFVNIPDANSLDLTTNYTIESWVNINTATALAGIVSKYHTVGANGYIVRLTGTSPFRGIDFDGLSTANNVLETGKWYHIAAVKNGATRTLYVNGVAQTISGAGYTVTANTDPIKIGSDYNARYFNGDIDEVRIWNTARTQAEIQANMFDTIVGLPSGLVAYYNFDNGTAGGTNTGLTTLADKTTNALNGTLSGFALTGTTSNWIRSTAWNTWLGTTNNAYATATNWQLGTVPTVNDNIVVPTGATNLPITVTTAQGFFNGQLQTGTSLTNTSTLSIGGNLFNSGTLESIMGEVAYNGTRAQTIAANTFNLNILQRLTINNTAGVTLGGILNITGTLTATSGTLTTGGFLTIATRGSITGNYANISGITTLQAPVIGQRGNRVFANPFSTTQTLSTVATNNSIAIATTPGVAGVTDARAFDPSLGTLGQWTNLTSTVAANQAYALFIRGLTGDLVGGTGLTYSNNPTAFTYNVSGTLNGNSVVLPTNATAGRLSIVGNPYAAPVNTQALTGGVSLGYQVYQITAGADDAAKRARRGSWVTVVASNNTTTIPTLGALAFQASTANITVANTDINTSGTAATNLFGTPTNNSLQYLDIAVKRNNEVLDNMIVRTAKDFTANGTDRYDLTKMGNDVVNVYSLTPDGKRLALDARNIEAEKNTKVQMGIRSTNGNYQLTINHNSLPQNVTATLVDKYQQTETPLNANTDYNFSITADAASQGEQRFEIVFSNSNTASIIGETPIVNSNKAFKVV